MPDAVIQEKLREKADIVSALLNNLGLTHTLSFHQYQMNFRIMQGAKQLNLSIAYSPNKNRWTPFATDDWVKEVVIPRIQPLFLDATTSNNSPLSSGSQLARSSSSSVSQGHSSYFANACECLSVLTPFAKEFLDFSIIVEHSKNALRCVINDHHYTNIDRALLLRTLESSPGPDYSTAKEYLLQCLTICHLPTNL